MAALTFTLAADLTSNVNPALLGFVLPDYWPGTNYITVVWPEYEIEIDPSQDGANGATTQRAVSSAEGEYDTATTTRSALSLLLFKCALDGEHELFASLVAEIEWPVRRADEIASAIDLALSMELAPLAMELAQLGGSLFPDDLRLQRAAHVLAPPVARVVPSQAPSGLQVSRDWLRNHAAEHRGQWVAVRDGRLLGKAKTLIELRAQVDVSEDPRSTIITKVT